MFVKHQRLENSLATTLNSVAKFCLFHKSALPFDNNLPVMYSPATPILNENPVDSD